MVRRAVLWCALLGAACTDHGTAPGPMPAGGVPLLPAFSALPATASATLSINRIRLTALDPATGARLESMTLDVPPTAERWEVAFDIRTVRPGTTIVVLIECIHAANGGESVEWSGRSSPITLRGGVEAPQPVTLFVGPPENLLITGLTLTGAPGQLLEGDTARARVQIESSAPGGARVFWTSSDASVLTVDNAGLITAVAPGSALVIAEAGARRDTARVQVRQRPTRVVVTPSSANLDHINAETVFTAQVLDRRGTLVAGEEVEWQVGDGAVAEHLGGGRVRARGRGTTSITAAARFDPSLQAAAALIVTQRVVRVTVAPTDLQFDARGRTATLSAAAADAGGAPVEGAQVNWTSSAPAVATVNAAGTVTAVENGNTTITATVDGVSATVAVRVQRLPAAITIAGGQSQTGEVGRSLPLPLDVIVSDAGGSPLAGASVTFTASAGSVAAALATTDGNGRASSGAWTLGTRSGQQSMEARVAGTDRSVVFSATARPGAPARLTAESGAGQRAAVGRPLPQPLVVRVTDAHENPVAGVAVTFAGPGALSPVQATTDSAGRANAVWTLPTTLGNHTAIATASGLTASFPATATPGAPAALLRVSSAGFGGVIGSTVGPLVVQVNDEFGNPLEGISVAFSAGGGTIAPASAVTGANGQASASWTLGTRAGLHVAQASLPGTSHVLVFTGAARAGPPAQLTAVSGSGQSANAGTVLQQPLVVRVSDAHNNPVAGTAVTFSGPGSFAPQPAVTGDDGTATVVWTLPGTAGNHTATASAAGFSASFSATAQGGAPSAFVAISPTTVSGTVGTALPNSLVVRVNDGFGNPLAGRTVVFTPSAGSVTPASVITGADGQASTAWTLGTSAGAQSVEAALSGTSHVVVFSATAVAGAPAQLGVVSGDGQTGGVGSALPLPLVVRLADTHGNPVVGATVTFSGAGTLAPTSAITSATGEASAGWTLPSTPGTYTATAAAGALTVPFSAVAQAGAAANITVLSGAAQVGEAGQPLGAPVVVRVTDGSGNAIPGATVSWSAAPGSGVLPATAVTDTGGVAQATWTLGAFGGRQAGIVAVGGVSAYLYAGAINGTVVTLDDDFDLDNGGAAAANITSLRHWEAVAGSVDLLGSGGTDPIPGNGLYLALAGSAGRATLRSRTGLIVQAGRYALTYLAAPMPGTVNGHRLTVRVNGVVVDSLMFTAPLSGFLMRTIGLHFASDGPLQVEFIDEGTGTVTLLGRVLIERQGAAAELVSVAGGGQTGEAGSTLSQPLFVAVRDAQSRPMREVPVTFAAADGGVIRRAGSTDAFTATVVVMSDALGMAGVEWKLGTGTGAQTVSATVASIPAVSFTATSAAAAANHWIAAGSGLWSNPLNWSRGAVPVETDSVVIDLPGTYTVTVNGAAEVRSIVVGHGSATPVLDVTAALSAANTIVVGLNSELRVAAPVTGTVYNSGIVTGAGSHIAGHLRNETAGVLRLTNSSLNVISINNYGRIELISAGSSSALNVTGGIVNRAGAVIEVLGPSESSIGATIDNYGLLKAGRLSVNNSSQLLTMRAGSELAVDTLNTVRLSNGTLAIETGALFTGAGTLQFEGTVSITYPSTGLVLEASGQAWSFHGAVTFSSSGTLTNRRTLTLSNDAILSPVINEGTIWIEIGTSTMSGVFTNAAAGLLRLQNSVLNLTGAVDNHGRIEMHTSASAAGLNVSGGIINRAAAVIEVDGTSSSVIGASIDNYGELRGGSLVVQNSSRTLNMRDGSLMVVGAGESFQIFNGTFHIETGAVMTGSGTLSLEGTLTVSYPADGTVLEASPLTWSMPGSVTFSSSGTLTNRRTLVLTSDAINSPVINEGTVWIEIGTSTMSGAFTNAASGLLRMQNGVLNLTGAVDNHGRIGMHTSASAAGLNVSGGIINRAAAVIEVDGTSSSVIDASIDNYGELRGGSLVVQNSSWTLNMRDGSLMVIGAGESFQIFNGTFHFETGAVMTGTGTLALAGTIAVEYPSTGAILEASPLTWTMPGAVTFSSTGTLTNRRTLVLSGDAISAPVINEGTIRIDLGTSSTMAGSLTNTATGLLRMQNGVFEVTGDVANHGRIELHSSASAAVLNAGGVTNHATGVIEADGTNESTIGASVDNYGTIVGGGLLLQNSGRVFTTHPGSTLSVQSGRTMRIQNGTMELHSGAAFTGPGTLSLEGTLAITYSSVILEASTMVWSTSSGNVTFSGSGTLTNRRLLVLTSDVINSSVVNEGTLRFSGASVMTGNITNEAGGLLQVHEGTLNLTGGVTNHGTFEISGTGSHGQLNASGGVVNETGALFQSVGGQQHTLQAVLDNRGTMQVAAPLQLVATNAQHVNSGSITLTSGNLTVIQSGAAPSVVSSGVISIGAGRTLHVTAGATTNQAGGIIEGVGTFRTDGTALLNNGSIRPGGAAAGTLTIQGSFTNGASGVVDIDINGPVAGTDYDVLNVTGTATLGGTIALNRATAYTPTVGTILNVLTPSTRSGMFAAVTGADISFGLYFDLQYITADVKLIVVSPG